MSSDFDHDRRFRRCMGTFATGVTVVAAHHDGEYAGMTLNAFTSVSLTPQLVSVALAHGTRTLELVNRSRRFAVSILESRQREVARAFAVPGAPFPERFAETDAAGHVRIPGALAFLACDASQQVTAGDHDIVVGQVTNFEAAPGKPLVFYGGDFGALATSCEAA
jgi:flavin reductase (DIM6/NTAB) family NADH-FMN oxidoreductase RutF